jgi:LPXTG-motif cell wall-anchored protein
MIRRSVALGCLLLGIVLLYMGYEKTQSLAGGISRAFSGGYSADTWAYVIAGAVLFVSGAGLLAGKKKGRKR